MDRAGFEPAASAVRGRHSFQTELPAQTNETVSHRVKNDVQDDLTFMRQDLC